jgi:hypothetical protein
MLLTELRFPRRNAFVLAEQLDSQLSFPFRRKEAMRCPTGQLEFTIDPHDSKL